jgi:aspartate/methionine/tyrosine aminotransferase
VALQIGWISTEEKSHVCVTAYIYHQDRRRTDGRSGDSLKDPEVLRLENLDTDLRPPQSARIYQTRSRRRRCKQHLPFFGLDVTRQAAASLVERQSGQHYDWKTECLISAGGLSGILNVLLATLEPGDEVLMTDPIYVGLINRVRLAGGFHALCL